MANKYLLLIAAPLFLVFPWIGAIAAAVVCMLLIDARYSAGDYDEDIDKVKQKIGKE